MRITFLSQHNCLVILPLLFVPFAALSQQGSITSRPDNPQAAQQLNIYEDALLRAYYDNPQIYRIHQHIINQPATATFYLETNTLPTLKSVYRMIGPAAGPLNWAAEKDEQLNDIEISHQMGNDPEEVRKTAHNMAEEMINPKSYRHKQIEEVYEETHRLEKGHKLPYSEKLESLKMQYPDAAEKYKPENAEKEKGKLQEMKKKDSRKFKEYVQAKYCSIPDRVPERPMTTEDQKRVEQKKYREDFAETQANFQASVEIISLVNPRLGKFVNTAGSAGFKIFDAEHTMAVQGFIDLKSLGNLANGIGILFSLFSEDGTGKALQQILENQKKILEKLRDLQLKAERLQSSVNYLISLTSYSFDQIKGQIRSIQDELEHISLGIYDTREFERLMAQYETLRDFRSRKNTLVDEFYRDAGTDNWNHRLLMLRYPGVYRYTDAQEYFSKVEGLLGEIANYINRELPGPDNIVFNDISDIRVLNKEEIESKRKKDVNQRMGMLAGMGQWLKDHIGVSPKMVTYLDTTIDHPNGSELFFIPNPQVLSLLVQQYLELASYRPLKYRRDRSLVVDENVEKYCLAIKNIEDDISEMREAIPLAAATMNFHLKQLDRIHKTFIYSLAKREGLAIYEDGSNSGPSDDFFAKVGAVIQDMTTREVRAITTNDRPKNQDTTSQMPKKLTTHDANDPFVLYAGLSFEEIKQRLTALPEENFINIGEKVGAFVKQDKDAGSIDLETQGIGSVGKGTRNEWTTKKVDNIAKIAIPTKLLIAKTQMDHLPEYYQYAMVGHYYGRKGPNDQFNSLSIVMVPSGQPEVQKIFIDALALFISQKHKELEIAWKEQLNENPVPNYLLDVYRSRLILETLLIGGYGPAYEYVPELKELGQTMTNANDLIDFVETNWKRGINVIDKASFDTTTTPFPLYFQRYAKFKTNKDLKTFRSEVIDYKIPQMLNSPFLVYVGDLQSALNALEWASQYPDLPSTCFPK